MIAPWMLYASFVGALFAVAAVVADFAARRGGRPTRTIWTVALALAVIWPLANATRDLLPHRSALSLPTIAVRVPPLVVANDAESGYGILIERSLIVVWVAGTLLLLWRLGSGVVAMRRMRRGWRRSAVDGTMVCLSENVGPAVVGLRPMDVVLPTWILSLDVPLRALVLRHEEEHRSARDPYLLFAAAVALVVVPWNVALWFIVARLRLAVEMDCDARVLRAFPSTERYGMLMLTIAQRRAVAPVRFAPMLSEPTTQLERRIVAMRNTARRVSRPTLLAGAAMAIAVTAVACSVQIVQIVVPASTTPSATPITGSSAKMRAMSGNQTYYDFHVDPQATLISGSAVPAYPEALQRSNIGGRVVAQFVVDTSGSPEPQTFKVIESTNAEFTKSVRAALPNLHFSPARVGARPVRQLVKMPFEFSLER